VRHSQPLTCETHTHSHDHLNSVKQLYNPALPTFGLDWVPSQPFQQSCHATSETTTMQPSVSASRHLDGKDHPWYETRNSAPPDTVLLSQRPAQSVPYLEVQQSVESCSIVHPGALCCSMSSVERDSTNNTCVVSITTTVRQTEPHAISDMSELEKLGWVAVKQVASQVVSSLNQKAAVPQDREHRHRHILNLLQHGQVVECTKMTNGFGHVSYVCQLQDPKTKQTIKALFKPKIEGDGDGWHRVPIEVASYQLNLMLGMDCVPPAVFRSECDVDWQHFEHGGVFIYWCNNAHELSSVPMSNWVVKPEVLLSDTRILDVLIQNSDRHAGHFLWAEHWAQPAPGNNPSSPHWKGSLHPVLIDHSAGFRSDAYVCMDHENAFGTGATKKISARTYLRLRFLDRATLSASLHNLITDDELSALLRRRDDMLVYFDKLVESKGYSNVVLEV